MTSVWQLSVHLEVDVDVQDILAQAKRLFASITIYTRTRMWANAQRDGRPAEHRWRPLFNAAKFG